MTSLLVNWFVKDHENTEDLAVRTAYGVMAGIVGILCNTLLFLVKVITGLMIHSVSVTADGMNNLSDAVSSIVSLFGARMAAKPADEKHPFGYGRMEYIAALIVAFMVLEVGMTMGKDALEKIREPQILGFSLVSVTLLCLSVLMKFWLFRFYGKLGRKLNASMMMATSQDALGDVFATTATILVLLVNRFVHVNIDGYAGLIVSCLILWGGIGIVRDTVTPLLGEKVDPEVVEEITDILTNKEAVAGAHDLNIHCYGPGRNVATAHIEVGQEMSLIEAHELADEIEQEVLSRTGISMLIHVDPVDVSDPRVLELRGKVENILQLLKPGLEFHEFGAQFLEDIIQVNFELDIPPGTYEEEEHHLIEQVTGILHEIDPRIRCSIRLDHGVVQQMCVLAEDSEGNLEEIG